MSNLQEIGFDQFITDFAGRFHKVYKDVVCDPLQFAIIGAAILIGSYFVFPGIEATKN